MHRLRVALGWSIAAYAALLGLLFLASLSVLLIVTILERLRWIPEAVRKMS